MASESKEEESDRAQSNPFSSRMAMEENKEERQPNECCQKWKEKLHKVETGRRSLREAIKLFESAFHKKEEEFAKLKKECEDQQKQVVAESTSAQEERRQRLELEEAHNSLKVELTTVLQCLDDQKDNAKEEKRLKELLEKERQALDLEKKKAEDLKIQMNAEKKKAEEEKKRADIARKKTEEERKNAGTERRKVEEEKKRADAERKRAEDEKLIRETLEKKLQQLELEKQTAEEAKRCYEAKENAPALVANVDKLSKGEKVLKELLKKEREQLKAERRRSEEQKKQIESLHKNLSVLKEQLEKEQQCLKSETKRAEEETLERQKLERQYSVLKEELESALVGDIDRRESKGEKLLKELLKKEHREFKAQRKRSGEQQKQIEFLRKEHFLLKEKVEKAELRRAEEEKRQLEALEKQCSVLKEELALAVQCLKSQEDQLNDTRRELQQLRIEVNAVDGSLICEKTLPRSKMLAKSRAAKVDRNASLLIGERTFPDARLSVSGGKFNEPIPCVSCVSEPSRGCSSEKQVQSSALHSTVTYFSDKQLVLSQERGAQIATNSSKMRKHKKKRELVAQRESPATSEGVLTQVLELPEGSGKAEDVKDCNEKRFLFGKQGSALSRVQNCTSKATIHKEINESEKEQNCSTRKRKVDPESLTDSLLDLFHKEKKVHLMIEEKLVSLKDALRNKQYTSANSVSTKLREIESTRKQKQEISASASLEEVMQSIDLKNDECKAGPSMNEDCSRNCSQIHMPNHENELVVDDIPDKEQTHVKYMQEFIGSGTTCDSVGKNLVEGASNFVETALQNQVNVTSVDCKIDLNIERMLQLDNESEEELYIHARQHPLSPTLPEIPSSFFEELDNDTFRDCSFEQVKDGDENVRICMDSHVTSSPIKSNHFFLTSGIISESIQPVLKKHAGLEEHSEGSSTQGGVLYAYNDVQSNKCEGHEWRCFSLYFNPSFCYDNENVSSHLFKSNSYLGVVIDVFSGVPDLERLILTIDSATMLSRQETACICISALVSNLASLQLNSESRSFCNSDNPFFLWSKNLIDQINKVSSKQATRLSFSKVFDLNSLVSLMTEFLIEGKVMVYTIAANGKQGSFHLSGSAVEAEQRQLSMLQRIATIAEVEAGSNVLASFCLALGSVECLYKVMYKVLRWCKKDHIWLHTVVYSITFLCWKHSLQARGSNLLGNTICTIVLLLEGHEKGYPQKFLDHYVSSSVQKKTYPLSMHCSFAEDVLSMDAIISSLLETLYHFPLSGYTGEKTPIKVLDCENSAFIGSVERKVESQKMNYCQQDGSASNSSQDASKHECQSQSQIFESASHLSILVDCVLALELVGQYLGWEWIYNELIPQFWRMAQPNAPEELIMAIFLLVGIIGRFGIDYDGCEQLGVEELRCNFSTLLDLHCMNTDRKIFSFSCQLAAAQSLYALISGNMKMSTANQVEPDEGIIGRKTDHSSHIKILKKWYSNLSEVHQSMLPEHIRVDFSPL